MAIYRGAGGAGDAVNDSSSEASAAVIAADAALAAKVAAEAARDAAQLSETNADASEANAASSATSASSAASAAHTYANNASNSAVSAANSATNAASSSTSAGVSATNAANSSTSAAGSASAAAVSATSASNSATSAAASATNAATSATSASTSASSASSSASTATTQASNASTSATNAASSASTANSAATTATTQAGIATTQATNASNSASAAATSATNAANSASTATTQASNASTSATAAQSAQTAAEAARDATLAAYDSFDDRYLGTKTSDPSVDNDGNALVAGALYFNSVDGVMKLWTGSIWTAAYVSGAGVLLQANNLSDLNNVSSARTNLGLGTAATTAATDYATAAQGAKADTALQPAAIGVSVQGYDADLTAFAGKTAPTGAVVGTSDTQTLTNKTIALGSNTVSGTLAEFNTAVTDADFASLAGTETLTNKTLTSPALTSPSISSGNLSFGTTGQRITGDFSNATASNRVAFQTSTTNGNTVLQAIPNGTATQTNFVFYSDSAQTNFAALNILQNTSETSFRSIQAGSGSYVPVTFWTGGSERLRIDTSGNVGIGTSSPSFLSGYGGLQINGIITNSAVLKLTNSTTGTTSTDGFDILIGAASSDAYVWQRESAPLIFGTAATERMRITSTGNVGIGTSSPSYRLHIAGGNAFMDTGYNYTAATGGGYWASGGGSYNVGWYESSGSMLFRSGTGGTTQMRLDSSGNLGLGVTPSAWSSGDKVIDIGTGVSYRGSGTNPSVIGNAYYNGTNWIYKTTATATYYDTNNTGAFRWLQAASGTAGNAITFTQAMTLNASGNLGIGTTSPSAKLDVAGAGQFTVDTNGTSTPLKLINNSTTGTVAAKLAFQNGGSVKASINAAVYNNDYMTFNVGSDTERMRIDSSGNVGIGATPSGTAKLDVNGQIYSSNGTASAPAFTSRGQNNAGLFFTDDGSASIVGISAGGTERMRVVGSSGNVGIGTSSPSQRLDVQAADYVAVRTLSTNSSIDTRLQSYSTGNYGYVGTVSNHAFSVITNNAERMRIDSSGNVLFAQAVRATITTDNDLSFDMNAASNFKCTPTAGGALTFTNITSGQSGNIILVNGSNYAITAAATTKVSSTCLATISATGTYWLSYFSDGTNVYVANTGALA